MKNKILFVCDGPSPYKIDFFNLLCKKMDIHIAFIAAKTEVRDKSWFKMERIEFEYTVLTERKCEERIISLSLIEFIKKHKFKEVVITNPTNLVTILAMWYMRMHSISYCISIDGARYSKKTIENAIKKSIFKGSKAFFSPSEVSDEYYIKNGVNQEAIVRYPFTSIYDEEIIPFVTQQEKKEAKALLNIKEKKMVLTIGQIIHRKGLDVLLNACNNLPADVGIYIVGGEPTEELKELMETLNLANINFVPFQEKNVIKTYMKAADIFAFPTREDIWGLVVNEAMSHGLPIITTDHCVAGLEMIQDGRNGYIIPINNSDILNEKMNLVLNDTNLCDNLAKEALSTIRHYTFEKMVEAHCSYFEKEY